MPYFLVRQARGPAWDPGRPRREQAGWDEHVEFVDRLTEQGRIVLGGPLDDVDGEYVMLLVVAAGEEEARRLFDEDPWCDGVLRIDRIERWNLWIGAEHLPPG
jgi:uncharacterized protein YciI